MLGVVSDNRDGQEIGETQQREHLSHWFSALCQWLRYFKNPLFKANTMSYWDWVNKYADKGK